MMMHPQFRIDMLRERSRELAKRSNRPRPLTAEPTRGEIAGEAVLLQLRQVSDNDPILERLAALEGRKVPHGRHLVAEVDGEGVAALPLAGGECLADPFRPTAHLLPLMRLRAAQLYASPRPRTMFAYARPAPRALVGAALALEPRAER